MTTTESPKFEVTNFEDDDDDELEKELNSFIEENENKTDEKNEEEDNDELKHKKDKIETESPNKSDDEEDKGQKGRSTDDEDSELEDYKITEDQKRALEEMELMKSELGLPEEDPPEYDVTEKLKIYNKELAEDPTPVDRRKDSKVGFKETLVDLVVPPSDDDETPRPSDKSKSDKVESDNKNNNNEKIVIEQGGKFEVVNSDDVRAKEYGLPQYIDESLNEDKENRSSSSHKPTPPSNPRPSTANNNSRRAVRPGPSKPRAQSARQHDRPLENFSYNSPYAMSPEDKRRLRQQQEQQEKQKEEEKRRKEEEEYIKQRENDDVFQSWWSKKKEQMKEQRKAEEDDKKKNAKQDRKNQRDEKHAGSDDHLYDNNQNGALNDEQSITESEAQEIEEAYNNWLKTKSRQVREEKLLKRRQEKEQTDGFYIRSRQECDQAFKEWLKRKNLEAKRHRQEEKQRARMHRLAARKSRKSLALAKAIKQSNAFKYVDYYGYRF